MNIFGTIYASVLAIMPGVMFIKHQSASRKEYEPLQQKNDEDLILLYKKNSDTQIIGILFDRYIHLVYAVCMKYYRDTDDSRDAAMEIFGFLPEKLLKHEITYFKGWLHTTTRNHCLMGLRKVKPETGIEKIEHFLQPDVENEGILHLDNKPVENSELVLKCLAGLKHEQKVCVEMMYLQGKSYKDIADETGYTEKNVKSYIQNGKRNLRIMIEQYNEQ